VKGAVSNIFEVTLNFLYISNKLLLKMKCLNVHIIYE